MRAVARAVWAFLVAGLLVVFLGGMATAAPIPPVPEGGAVAARWVCTHHDPVTADPGPPEVEAEFGYSGCAVTEWADLPAPEAPTPSSGADLDAVVDELQAVQVQQARSRVVEVMGFGLVVFAATAAFFRGR